MTIKIDPALATPGTKTYQYDGHYILGHNGYGCGFRCAAYPRLRIIDFRFKGEFAEKYGPGKRTWYVDGTEVSTFEIALSLLAAPPKLLDHEKDALSRLIEEFIDLREFERGLADELIAGDVPADKAKISVITTVQSLRDKGMIEFGKREWPADYKPESDFAHLRWSPTIRRRAQAKWREYQ